MSEEAEKPVKRRRVEKPRPDPGDVKKGRLLAVKAPPYYTTEYTYEVTGAGGKVIRASLKGSPRVKKSWSREELGLLMQMGIVRYVED